MVFEISGTNRAMSDKSRSLSRLWHYPAILASYWFEGWQKLKEKISISSISHHLQSTNYVWPFKFDHVKGGADGLGDFQIAVK